MDIGKDVAADYIQSLAGELSALARKANLAALTHILEMARMEAAQIGSAPSAETEQAHVGPR